MNIDNLSEKDILNVKTGQPEIIFSGTECEIKKTYKKLSLLWHPDKTKNKNSSAVFSHIHDLYISAIEKLANGTLGTGKNILEITSLDGKKFKLTYIKEKNFEMGKYYIAHNIVAWCFDNNHIDEVKEGLKNLDSVKFIDETMRTAFKKYIPEVIELIESESVFYVLMKKPKGFLNVGDIWEHYKRNIPAEHVAWIVSNLYNQLCFIHHNNLMFGGINTDNYYINPETHEGMLVGGWWYSCKQEQPLSMLSTNAVDVAPVSLLNSKKAEYLLDLEMVKLLGRELLGDKTGNYLKKNTSIPESFTQWFRVGSKGTAISEYSQWNNQVLIKSFGKRKFVEMKINSDDIYREV